MKVIKRDGRKVDFNKKKIVSAIEKAMKKTEGGVDESVSNSISDSIEKTAKGNMTVEDIQDLVEYKLMSSKRKDVAREYITYRNLRSEEREKNSSLMDFVSDVIDLSNIENENANMPEWVFTAKNVRMSSEVAKRYAMNHLLDSKVKEAFVKNKIHIHDFSMYAVGNHNCVTIDLQEVLENGFTTNNGDVRPPSTIRSAMQLTAVILQCQSNCQFGGVAVSSLDHDLATYVAKSFIKHFKTGLKYIEKLSCGDIENIVNKEDIKLDNKNLSKHREAFKYAKNQTVEETYQAAEALIHNLNTLQSRAGDQLPFTSVNFGTDTSTEGRLVTESMLKATIKGVGSQGLTPIFPISIFKHKRGVNDKEGTPNYDLKKLAIECSSKRIYPNFANVDAPHLEPATNKLTEFCTMGR